MGCVRSTPRAAIVLVLLGHTACSNGAGLTTLTDPFGSVSNIDTGDSLGSIGDDSATSGPDDTTDATQGVTETTLDDPTVADSSTTKPDDTEGETGVVASCGNGVVEADEACDAEDLGGEDCVSQGFVAGVLACKKDCSLDTAACTDYECGNGVTEAPESCDGADLAGASCQTQGFSMGVLGCAADCSFDAGGCSNPACGNDVIEQGEVCDGEDLGGESCVSQGNPGGGTLVCLGNCSGYDTSGCACEDEDIGGAIGASVSSGNTSGDDNDLDASCGGVGGNDRVVAFTAPAAGQYVFDTLGSGFDTKLAIFSDCATEIACNDDFGGLQSQLTLDMNAGQRVLVVVDGYGGASGAYVLNIGNGALACQDQDIGGSLGASVASGNTGVADNDLDPTCGAGDALDQSIRFTAPAAAQYTFDTFGSGYDTVLSLWSDCSTSLACNDDSGVLQSALSYDLAAGQVVLVLVDGYNGATGNWVLNVSSP